MTSKPLVVEEAILEELSKLLDKCEQINRTFGNLN